MKTRKKCYKSYKFWITTLLALSATSVFASLVLTSCTVNVTKNEDITSDVVISKEPNKNQEVSADSESGLTLSIDAKSTQGKDLKYQWYVDKTQLDNWNVISGATNSSYQIPSSELKSVTSESTWRYKAEIQYNDGSNAKLTSSIYTIKITPPTSTTPPENPSPEPMPPDEPEKPEPDEPITPPTTPEPPKPPISTPEEPEIPPTPKPEPTPPIEPEYKTIYPRQNTVTMNNRGEGLTTIAYPQEEWIGDNSVSIAFVCTPNLEYVKKYLTEYLEQNSSDKNENGDAKEAYEYASLFRNVINGPEYGYQKYPIYNGTGWMLDYSIDSATNNLVNYYLGTNIHVLDASYSISFLTTKKVSSNVYKSVKVTASIPINKESVTNLSVYLSQPQYDKTSALNNLKVPINSLNAFNNAWYKTSITSENFSSSLINLGSYNSSATPSLSTPYTIKLNYYYEYNNYEYDDTLYYPSSKTTATKSMQKSSQSTTDFGVLKITESKASFDKYISSGTWGNMFQKMKTMFTVDTTGDSKSIVKNSSYISRLNALLTLTTSKEEYEKNKSKISELFMFADYQKDLNDKTTLSIAGFPATRGFGTDYYSYSNFNSNTVSYSLTRDTNNYDKQWRQDISYNQNGQSYFSSYTWNYDRLLPNINLMGGSSGSMSITQDYKITGIYWGILTYSEKSEEWGIISKLYSQSDNMSMIKLWLKYIQTKDTNSKLATLFNRLSTFGYFS